MIRTNFENSMVESGKPVRTWSVIVGKTRPSPYFSVQKRFEPVDKSRGPNIEARRRKRSGLPPLESDEGQTTQAASGPQTGGSNQNRSANHPFDDGQWFGCYTL
jgi:hypothetical protein